MTEETFGSVLRQLMKDKKITHAALARSVGVHRTTITDYVNDKYLPDTEKFNRIHQVIPDKVLYDKFFSVVEPNARKQKELVSKEGTYNFYKAKLEKALEITTSIGVDKSDEEYQIIARALLFTLTEMSKNNITLLSPELYSKYKKVYEKYEKYLNI